VLAALYRHGGGDLATTIPDYNGRPLYVLDDREPVRELLPAWGGIDARVAEAVDSSCFAGESWVVRWMVHADEGVRER
jgi:hypothetical protein